jgi:hypothetical protein
MRKSPTGATAWESLNMRNRSLNRAQSIIVVIGLGLVLFVIGEWLTALGSHLPTGWVGYAPLSTGDVFGGFHPWVRVIIWILLIAVWVRSSTALFSTKSDGQHHDIDS